MFTSTQHGMARCPPTLDSNAGVADVEAALAASPRVLRGAKFSMASQGHMYMEPQTAVAVRSHPSLAGLRATSASPWMGAWPPPLGFWQRCASIKWHSWHFVHSMSASMP
jgi:hypothetical protein